MRGARARRRRSTRWSMSATAMEEDIDRLAELAGELGMIGTPVFVFQEGRDAKAERAFREIARLSRGAYAPFRCRLGEAAARAAHRGRGLRRGRPQGAERFQRGDEERRSLASPRAARLTGLTDAVFPGRLRAPRSAAHRRAEDSLWLTRASSPGVCAKQAALRRSPQRIPAGARRAPARHSARRVRAFAAGAGSGWFGLGGPFSLDAARRRDRNPTSAPTSSKCELDHDSGQMDGKCLIGRFAGRTLSTLSDRRGDGASGRASSARARRKRR